jgi:cellulose synthase/poly-beta-1,6-N-acetylglucosamine synthase-like glycosyltransferase
MVPVNKMEILFWIFVVLSVYSYLLFPISLVALANIVRRPWVKKDIRPLVSVVISVYNEERFIAKKIENALALNYPAEQLEILVISDGSTDKTEKIVQGFSDGRVVLKAFRERSGKTSCLNRAVPEARGDIILFTDANSMFPRDILVKLVRYFADPEVGLVTGWTRYGEVDKAEDTTGVYSRFEKWTKIQESLVSSCVGADGAVFAIRKELFGTLREDDINDFVIPLNVIRQGRRAVMDPDVYCYEKSADDAGKEYQRQVRITNRTLNAIRRNSEFLNPLKYGWFTYFLLSHKIMRFLVPFFLIATFGANLMLLGKSYLYSITLGFQLFALSVAILGFLGFAGGRITDIAKFFLVTLLAQLSAWFRTFAGISDTMWTPQR